MVYKSKIGVATVSILAIVYTGCCLVMLLDDAWPGILVLTPFFCICGHTLASTYYVVEDEMLRVRSGLFYNKTYSIMAFRKIIKTNSALTAPAASLDRLELFFNGYDSVVISPKDKDAFIAHLMRINPNIIYDSGSIGSP
jgi:hypothetical protein